MIRWLSHLWISSAIDRGDPPPKLWQWMFGRLKSHRLFASQLYQLDSQLKRQALSQQRSIAQAQLPIGDYPARQSRTQPAVPDQSPIWLSSLLRPALAAGFCLMLAATAWLAWPSGPEHDPNEIPLAFEESFNNLWTPLSEQARTTSDALREQTTYITELPNHLPKIDRVVQDLGQKIETPIREEMRRFANDMTRPWTHLASQLPLPIGEQDQQPKKG